jgi:hypothetical protein
VASDVKNSSLKNAGVCNWVSQIAYMPPITFYLFMCVLSDSRVHQFPEELPKIDFYTYKTRLPNAALVDTFEKAVCQWSSLFQLNQKIDIVGLQHLFYNLIKPQKKNYL